jgi:flagellar FliL protein
MSMISLPDTARATAPTRARSSVLSWSATAVSMTALATLCGLALAFAIDRNFVPPAPVADAEAPKLPVLNPEYTDRALHVAAKPMVTNLGAPGGTWIRLEGSFVMTGLEPLAAERLAAEVQQDMLGYLRTTSLAQLEGASGLLHLREDLNDIAKVHSGGHVTKFILETMVVQ